MLGNLKGCARSRASRTGSAVGNSGRAGLAGASRAAASVVLAFALALSMAPAAAFAYFDRGPVEVSLGTENLEVATGQVASTTVTITPASEDQTEGCGMPKCPQGCSSSCCDENGQCGCAGKEYKTYYPAAQATSSNAAVAVATYSAGSLTVYAKQAGEATITVRASLRQHTDAQTTLTVKVNGSDAGSAASTDAFVDVPEAAASTAEDKVDIVDKTVMNRAIRMVRIADGLDAQAQVNDYVGVDGDLTFWSGDTYYHPDYSLTFKGTDIAAGAPELSSCRLSVSTKAEGTLYQALSGKDCFVAVDFDHKGALPAPVTVYALANGAISDGQAVALYSYDAQTKSFVAEDATASMVGGYATFTVAEGKTYVVSCTDLTTAANAVVTGGASQTASAGSCCDPSGSASSASSVGQQVLSPFLLVVVVAVIAAAVGAGVAVAVMRRRGAGGVAGAGGADPAAASAPAADAAPASSSQGESEHSRK